MYKWGGNKNVGLLTSVKKKALFKKEEDEKKQQLVPYLHKDLVSSILIRLPLESLQHSRFVCKPWFNIVSSPLFIDDHLGRSESVLIFLRPYSRGSLYHSPMTPLIPEKPNVFSVEANLHSKSSASIFGLETLNRQTKFCMQFVEFQEGKSTIRPYNLSCIGRVRAACNGLILLDNKLKKGGLIVMNPVTRKLDALPVGTLCAAHKESYGFALNNVTGDYKVVHLFQDEIGYVSCEILNARTRSWRGTNGPAFGLFGWFGYRSISAIGALHWVPHVDRNDYLVSMEVEDDKFHTVPLPETARTKDGIIEMGGHLCFVTHKGLNIEIWSLESLSGCKWIKRYSISEGVTSDMVPLCSQRISGDVIFRRRDQSIHVFDVKSQVVRKIEMDKEFTPVFDECLVPHVNSLVSW
ncbi:hypothetical protein Tsubulata_018794 [Turnera subulata]|uniref:F-box domain-containing protein n=1 Tax=Turnera subulata TaxID=218843 RepID=A0A9Q0FJU6_9ROSI|nr:hypothetical protein Tsubulata_018794 [Turnera subulata]